MHIRFGRQRTQNSRSSTSSRLFQGDLEDRRCRINSTQMSRISDSLAPRPPQRANWLTRNDGPYQPPSFDHPPVIPTSTPHSPPRTPLVRVALRSLLSTIRLDSARASSQNVPLQSGVRGRFSGWVDAVPAIVREVNKIPAEWLRTSGLRWTPISATSADV